MRSSALDITALSLLAVVFSGCVAAKPLRLEDSVIADERVWAGEVRIRGVVTVKKEGSLTIRPGTRVIFERIDRDGDGIGDGEILVEGHLVIAGTPKQPVVLTSAAAEPRPADWKYLYLDFAREARIENLVAEYAFSGIQVHFCKASIADSVFRHNIDGVRFSTVNLELSGSRIYDNRHGLRYEERRGDAYIHHNEIRDNDIGIFVVTRSDDRSRIEQNNIVGNRRYNVKLGIEQSGDVTLPRNWWGTTDPGRIGETFFDRRYDRNLGRVAAPQPLGRPVIIETTEGGDA